MGGKVKLDLVNYVNMAVELVNRWEEICFNIHRPSDDEMPGFIEHHLLIVSLVAVITDGT